MRAAYGVYGYGPYGYGRSHATGRTYSGYGNGLYGNGSYSDNSSENRVENGPVVGGIGYGYPNFHFRPRGQRGTFTRGYGISDNFSTANYNPFGYFIP